MLAVLADVDRLTAENKKLAEDVQRITAEHTDLHLALDAERAKPSQESLSQQVISLKDQLEQMSRERDLLKEQAPAVTLEATASAPVTLSSESHARIKSDFLDALAEHAVAEVAPEAMPPEHPFINRQ
jgi:hypothetical protein